MIIICFCLCFSILIRVYVIWQIAYLQFMLHCYIDTDIELKDASNNEYLESILDDVIADMGTLSVRLRQPSHGAHPTKFGPEIIALERYICQTVTEVMVRLFEPASFGHTHYVDIRVRNN